MQRNSIVAKPSPARVLIVDDELSILQTLEDFLEGDRYFAKCAESAEEAQKLLEDYRFDVVVTDVCMPGLDGMYLTQRIKQDYPQTEVILMTGYASATSVAQALELGAFDYLIKPFPSAALVRLAIDRAVAKKRREEALRSMTNALEASRQNFANIVERAVDGMLVVSNDKFVLYSNESALKIFGKSHEETVGEPFGYPLQTGQISEIEFPRADGEKGFAEVRTVPTIWGNNHAYLVVIRDTTESVENERLLRKSLNEKEILLKEVHHRVKNNLQVICSLLNLQVDGAESSMATWLLRDSQNRIRSIALIHEKLYQSQDLARIDFPEYIRSLAYGLLDSYRMVIKRVELDFDLDNVELDLEIAIPCALIINELLSNALKHAFAGDREGKIHIKLHRDELQRMRLVVKDDGIGIPDDFDIDRTESLGMRLIRMLVAQLSGELHYGNNDGAMFEIIAPAPIAKAERTNEATK